MQNEMELYRVQVDIETVAWFREEARAKAFADDLYDEFKDAVTIGQPYTFTPLVYGAAGWTVDIKKMTEQERATHLSHCCGYHGCKYGEDEICPVYADKEPATYPGNNGCEVCEDFDAHEVKLAKRLVKRLIQDSREPQEWYDWLVNFNPPGTWEDAVWDSTDFDDLYHRFIKDTYTSGRP